jgi:ABC-2 type transport system permease protein
VLQDFIASMRPFAADSAAFDAFTKQWFFEVVVPEYSLHDAKKAASGEFWDAIVRVENQGTGEMPVEVAATRGERFNKDGSVSPEYKESRATIVLSKGGSKDVVIRCPFEPAQIVVDPDAKILQLRRESAAAKL